jgi:small subunit ribosomal protein S16
MVRIRLRRTGLRNQPTYRVIVADIESPRDGRFIEILGSYNPRTEPFTLDISEERVYHWMKNGAQPSESVAKLFKSVGLLDRFARVKAGEPVETIVAEAKVAYEKRVVDPKTRQDKK